MTRTVWLIAAFAGLHLFAVANCSVAQIYTGSQPVGIPLIPRAQAERSGLHRSWTTQLPMDGARSKVTSIRMYDGLILAVTDEGMLHVVDAESGKLKWSFQAGDRNTLTLAAGANATRVAVASTGHLFVLDRTTGDLLIQRRLTGTPERGPVLTSNHVLLPLVRGPIEVYPLSREAEEDFAATYLPGAGRSIGHVAVTPVGIAWTGDLNRVFAHQFGDIGAVFDSAVPDGVTSGVTIFAPYLFVGTQAGFLLAFDAQRGNEAWRFSTGTPIRELPISLGSIVYVLPEEGGMHALVAKTGERLWYSPDPRKYVGASPNHLYTLDAFGRIAILDVKTGTRVGLFALPRELKFLPNDATDRLYFYTDRGLIQCLHETQLVQPHIFERPKPIMPEKSGPKPADAGPPADASGPADIPAPAEAAPAAEAPAPGDNPFGN